MKHIAYYILMMLLRSEHNNSELGVTCIICEFYDKTYDGSGILAANPKSATTDV